MKMRGRVVGKKIIGSKRMRDGNLETSSKDGGRGFLACPYMRKGCPWAKQITKCVSE